MSAWTAEQVEAMAEQLNLVNLASTEHKASRMLRAYAATLRQQAALAQSTQGEAIPAFWAAVSDDGEIAIAYSADDGNSGAAARTECNQWINDHGGVFHLRPLYLHAERARVPTDAMLAAFVHTWNGGSEWLPSPMNLTKRQLARARKAYDAFLAAAPSQPEDAEEVDHG